MHQAAVHSSGGIPSAPHSVATPQPKQQLRECEAPCRDGSLNFDTLSLLTPADRSYCQQLTFGSSARGCFNMEPNMTFLNQAMCGFTPRPVLNAQSYFVNRMELNPDRFLRRELPTLLRRSAEKLAEVVGADSEDVVFVPNISHGVNAVLRSMDLQEGDEVLCMNSTYPGVFNTLRHICYMTQEVVELKVVDVKLPLESYESLIQQLAAAITPNTRVAVLDHITSAAALVLPLDKLIPLFQKRGIPVLVDGANAPGQVPLDLRQLKPDFYVGTCNKWLFGSKSSSFLYVDKEHQSMVRPVVTSLSYNQGFIEEFAVQGTKDESNYLTICTAIDFYQNLGYNRVCAHNKSLIDWASSYLASLWGTEALLPPWQRAPFASAIRLPIQWPVKANGEPLTADEQCQVCCFVMDILLDYYQLATKVIPIEGSLYVRISAQIYNERADFERLGVAIQGLTNCSSFIEMFSTMRV
ncbi:hypothetical protein H257_03675 [Aphanomyces astaci]|uniref:Aminotransferase class V domain-containing protein n=1 Tax=Aphanomyces astaci TaxID=112090 RepID=W4GZY4_APHAT|nr:hypothetical protein H257_03675 [Aphanomyces astaci]ETV84478.1 hypothetical protein H257_03675 [Aphanomyces astaci]RHX99862.1 hypothetical protein DYB25_008516 [Aphanomyces astaci]RHY06315.1 hypothetical protein DYB36_006442 [Aphanomyces astaci]RHY50866.1 hypothetical protein DYB38_003759 [Aphanomyces astaci]RHY59751.1 hypothetical protein DYB30_004228 [Aphanomyces astaci]|eukprot:XP_009826170.1 hypothetical protein H257_03675 [Aphanomyces astaci]